MISKPVSRNVTDPSADEARPFAGLSPEVVLDARASAGFDADGRLTALNSY